MSTLRSRARFIWCPLILLLAADPLLAGVTTVYRDGRVVRGGEVAKSQQFCNANFGTLLQITDAIVPAPPNGQVTANEGDVVNLQVQVTLTAYCGLVQPINPAAIAQIQLDYGIQPGGSAAATSDYGPTGVRTVQFNNVAVFTAPLVASTNLQIPIVNDTAIENEETILVGLVDGGVFETPANIVAAINGDGRPLVTVRIANDDFTPIDGATNALLPGDPVANDMARALQLICAQRGQDPDILAQCTALRAALDASNATVAQSILRALAPEEAATQSSSVVEIRSGSQTERVQGRLATLRGGALRTATSTNTLMLRLYDSDGLPLQLQADDSAAPGGLFDQRLGGFLTADFGRGDRDASLRESGFDYDRFGATGGLDWRFTDQFVAGIALGYNRFDADLADQGGTLETSVRALTLYGSYSPTSALFLDASLGSADFSFDQQRVLAYNNSAGILNRTASASFDAEQLVATLTGGYNYAWNDWSFTPSLNYEWSRTDTDSFAETGAGGLGLFIRGQDTYSALSTLRLQLTRAISTENGVLVPYGNISLQHESRNENRPTEARFLNDLSRVRILISTEEADNRYGQLGTGVNWLLPNGIQLYLDYRRSFGLSGFSLNAFSAGARLEF